MKLHSDLATGLTDMTNTAEFPVSPGSYMLLFDVALKPFPIILDNDRFKMEASADLGS